MFCSAKVQKGVYCWDYNSLSIQEYTEAAVALFWAFAISFLHLQVVFVIYECACVVLQAKQLLPRRNSDS